MAYVDTGLGWYLNEDYLLTLGNVTLGTVVSEGGASQYDLPLYTGALSSFTKDYGLKTYWAGSTWTYYNAKHTDVPVLWCYAWNAQKTNGIIAIMSDYPATIYEATYDGGGGLAGRSSLTLTPRSQWPELESPYWNMVWTGSYQIDPDHVIETPYNDATDILNYVYRNYYAGGGSTTSTLTKPQGGAGAFAIVSYPHDGETVYVGVGISSIPIPNSAATVALDGTNGSHNTFNREGVQFTMFYTEPLTGTLTANVPVVALDTDISGLPGVYEPRLFLAVAEAAQIHVGDIDPYSGAGESEPGAEEATFDFDSTAVDFGTPPTVTAAGMVELYIPSTSDLASLAQYLWAGSFDPDNFKKLFADPMDAIIGLQIVPVTATEIGTTPDTLHVGNISTGLSMPKASRQYVPVDCGSLSIPRRLGSYLDYSPHTEMQLYLPYIGFVDISPDDCMGGTVSIKYLVDIIGGTCVAQVKCNDHVLYEYAAACSCQVPVSAGQYQNIVLGAVRGGIGLVSGILGAAGGGLFSGLSEAADAAMSMTKPKIQRSGGFGGSSGLMGHQTPYIIYTVPRLIVPGRQNNFIGYPSYITRTLGDLTGYTQIDSIHLTGIPASQSEQAEIEQLLQEGVYL